MQIWRRFFDRKIDIDRQINTVLDMYKELDKY